MKRLGSPVLSAVLVLFLVTIGAGCFGNDDEAGGGDAVSDEGGEPDVAEPDVIIVDGGDWELVMIIDSPDNTADTCNAGNPGADIDAVEIYRDGLIFGWADSVEAMDTDIWGVDWPCDNIDNDKDDPDEMLSQADGVASAEEGFSGYFSLNGRTVYLLMSEIMENGDELVIYEMFDADNPEATVETYRVYLGYYTGEGDMAFVNDAFLEWNTGTVTGTVDGLW